MLGLLGVHVVCTIEKVAIITRYDL
jgi:hypothetical protein